MPDGVCVAVHAAVAHHIVVAYHTLVKCLKVPLHDLKPRENLIVRLDKPVRKVRVDTVGRDVYAEIFVPRPLPGFECGHADRQISTRASFHQISPIALTEHRFVSFAVRFDFMIPERHRDIQGIHAVAHQKIERGYVAWHRHIHIIRIHGWLRICFPHIFG